MSRRLLARLAAVVLFATAGVVGFVPSPVPAEAPQHTGWWSRRAPFSGEVQGNSATRAVPYSPAQDVPDTTVPGTTVPGPVTTLPPPVTIPPVPEPPVTTPEDSGPAVANPTVPDGGLWVANDPAGAVAISAIRYRGDVGSAELTLRFAPGSTTVGPVVACPALSDWEPGPGGAWSDRPAHDCDRIAISGSVTPDGGGLVFPIPQGFLPFGERVLDVILLPNRASGDVFSLYFEAPGADSLEVISGQELPPPVPELPPIDPAVLPSAPFTASDPVPPGAVDVGGSPVGAPTSTEEAGGTVEPQLRAPDPVSRILEPFTESRTARILAVAVLLAMGTSFWFFGARPVRAPQLLGALAGDRPVVAPPAAELGRGIGRFRRDRLEPPNRL